MPATSLNACAVDEVARKRFVVIGDTTTAQRVCAALTGLGHEVEHLVSPGDREVSTALASRPDGVAILVHNDEISLRHALVVAHADPSVTIVASIFDATVSAQMRVLIPQCVVTSPGGLAAPVLAAACLAPGAAALYYGARGHGEEYVATTVDDIERRPWRLSFPRGRALRGWLASQVLPHDTGSALVTVGLVGMLLVLGADWLWLVSAGEPVTEAFAHAAATLVTAGPPPGDISAAYDVFVGVAMLATLVLAAMFVAGLVDQLLGPRLIGMFGARALPRSGHVVVVGLGQVGLRLCRHLMALGVPVVGVERDERGRWLTVARNLRIPVVVGHGGDRLLLERLRVRHALALAAVGSTDLDNIAVAVAARGVDHHARVVLRAGEDHTISETASLLPLGSAVDITELSAAYVIAHLLGRAAKRVVPCGRDILVEVEGDFLVWSAVQRDGCRHARRVQA